MTRENTIENSPNLGVLPGEELAHQNVRPLVTATLLGCSYSSYNFQYNIKAIKNVEYELKKTSSSIGHSLNLSAVRSSSTSQWDQNDLQARKRSVS